MADPFIAEVRYFSFPYAPRGWALCNGQLLPIRQNTALFSLLGVTYGGDGQSTFGLPNLQGRVPLGAGTNASNGTSYPQGSVGGQESVTLTLAQTPVHTHGITDGISATEVPATQVSPSGAIPAGEALNQTYIYGTSSNAATANILAPVGNNQSHPNMPPYLVINFCIALTGVFPIRS